MTDTVLESLIEGLSLNTDDASGTIGIQKSQKAMNKGKALFRVPQLKFIMSKELEYFSYTPKAKTVPNVFKSFHEYVTVMIGNAEAEYYESIRNAVLVNDKHQDVWHNFSRTNNENEIRVPHLKVKANDGETAKDTEMESFTRHIIQIKGDPDLLFVKDCDHESGVLEINSFLKHEQGQIRSLGYIGSYILQYQSIKMLEESQLLRMIMNPGICKNFTGGYTPVKPAHLENRKVPINDSQKNALLSLKGGLEVIHGPPGTGKSTTIWHVINSLLLPDSQCLVTCCRNQAVEAVIDKVSEFGVLVFGNDDRLGTKSKANTLEGRLKSDPVVLFVNRVDDTLSRYFRSIREFELQVWKNISISFPGIENLKNNGKATKEGRNASQLWYDALHRILPGVAIKLRLKPAELKIYNCWKTEVGKWDAHVKSIQSRVRSLRKAHILANSRIYLCTIDSTSRMARQLQDHEVDLKLDTCIVDEAGCVLEISIPILLRFNPKNLLLIGDHKQLQPFSAIDNRHCRTNHTRSLLERATICGIKSKMLTIQYRMHPKICSIVSNLFYQNKLETSPTLVRETKTPCVWFDAPFKETEHKARGYSNVLEAEKVLEVVSSLSNSNPKYSIFVITFYNKQRSEISKKLEANTSLKTKIDKGLLSVLSVDKCQGSEADYVVLSTVRSSGMTLFLQDKRRLCVALSRSKESLWIVGNYDNFRKRGGPLWKKIMKDFTRIQSKNRSREQRSLKSNREQKRK